jgi:hypothetical protein
MKVLWITNVLFPEVCDKLNINPTVIGGWQYSFANYLVNNSPTLELIVAVPYEKETIQFLKDAKKVLAKYSVMNIYNNDTRLKPSDLLEENGSNFIIERPNTPFAQSFPSDYYPGTINPLKKRILRQT